MGVILSLLGVTKQRFIYFYITWASLVAQLVKNLPLQCRRPEFDPWVRKIPWRRKWQPTQVFLPGKFHRQRSLVSYSPWGHKELDMSEQLSLKKIYCPKSSYKGQTFH